jgi:hypothetical protein
MWLLMASAFGIVAVIALVFFILKLFAATANTIPGSAYAFEFFITTAPYFILFAAYFLVHKKISAGKISASSIAARIILTIGSLICVAQLTVALLSLFKIRISWISEYEFYNRASFALHLIMILIAAGVLATGTPKEKSWMERE